MCPLDVLMHMTPAGLWSGVEQQKVPVHLEVHLFIAGPGVGREWTSQHPPTHTQALESVGLLLRPVVGGTPRGDREVHTETADAPRSRLPSPSHLRRSPVSWYPRHPRPGHWLPNRHLVFGHLLM